MHDARDTGRARALPITSSRRAALSGTVAAVAGTALALLGGRAAAHGGPVALPGGAGDDAELLALCQTFSAEHAIVTAWDAGSVTKEIGEAAHDRWWACVDKIGGIPAWTWEGVRAKADVANRAVYCVSDSQCAVDDLVRYVLAEVATWEMPA